MRITCPMCKKVIPDAPDDYPARPFCSPRCKLEDLHNWLGGKYRIPSEHESSEMGGSDPSASN